MSKPVSQFECWPSLRLNEWQDTYATLHMWTQIVGKVRLKLAPHINHWWQVTFYVTPRGLTTSAIPYGQLTFEVQFDFIRQILSIQTSEGQSRTIALRPRSVADFYRELSHNGGIYNTFAQNWYDMQVKTVQYGLGTKGHRSRMNGDWVSGPDTLTEEEMGANRYDLGKTYFAHPLDDDFYKAMRPDWSKVKVPEAPKN